MTETQKVICTPVCLNNCNDCKERPNSAWSYMSQLVKKYLKDDFKFTYHKYRIIEKCEGGLGF